MRHQSRHLITKSKTFELFDDRPKEFTDALKNITENIYWIDRYNVYSIPVTISTNGYTTITLSGANYDTLKKFGMFRDSENLAPNWSLECHAWFSKYQNDVPIGRIIISRVKTPPVILTVLYNSVKIDFMTAANISLSNAQELFLEEDGKYYFNLWYNGHNQGQYINLTVENHVI